MALSFKELDNIPEADQTSGSLEKVDGEILPASDPSEPSELLPSSIMDDVKSWLLDFSTEYNIDLEKCANLQWRAACQYVGRKIQASGILLDMEKLRQRGGSKYYKPEAVAALLPVWEWFTGIYKHLPLACDFIAFSGISREWFYDTRGILTSSRVDIAKKAREIEEAALSVAITDHRENPTGRIYYTKARLGWQETTTIQHVSVTADAPAVSLPVFGQNVPEIPEKTTD